MSEEEYRRRMELRRIGREEMPGWWRAQHWLAQQRAEYPLLSALARSLLQPSVGKIEA
jgi:hypothetical protein